MRGRLHKGWLEAKVGTVEESGQLGEPEREAFGGSSAQGDVTKFAAGTRSFSVKVQMCVSHSQDFRRLGQVANQIDHSAVTGRSRRAKGQT